LTTDSNNKKIVNLSGVADEDMMDDESVSMLAVPNMDGRAVWIGFLHALATLEHQGKLTPEEIVTFLKSAEAAYMSTLMGLTSMIHVHAYAMAAAFTKRVDKKTGKIEDGTAVIPIGAEADSAGEPSVVRGLTLTVGTRRRRKETKPMAKKAIVTENNLDAVNSIVLTVEVTNDILGTKLQDIIDFADTNFSKATVEMDGVTVRVSDKA
jgi:hypothetical protein